MLRKKLGFLFCYLERFAWVIILAWSGRDGLEQCPPNKFYTWDCWQRIQYLRLSTERGLRSVCCITNVTILYLISLPIVKTCAANYISWRTCVDKGHFVILNAFPSALSYPVGYAKIKDALLQQWRFVLKHPALHRCRATWLIWPKNFYSSSNNLGWMFKNTQNNSKDWWYSRNRYNLYITCVGGTAIHVAATGSREEHATCVIGPTDLVFLPQGLRPDTAARSRFLLLM